MAGTGQPWAYRPLWPGMWHLVWRPKAESPQEAPWACLLTAVSAPSIAPRATSGASPASQCPCSTALCGTPQPRASHSIPQYPIAQSTSQPTSFHSRQHPTDHSIPQHLISHSISQHLISHSIPQHLPASHSSQHTPSQNIPYPQHSTSYRIPGLLPMRAGVSPLAPAALGQGLPAAPRAPSVPAALP